MAFAGNGSLRAPKEPTKNPASAGACKREKKQGLFFSLGFGGRGNSVPERGVVVLETHKKKMTIIGICGGQTESCLSAGVRSRKNQAVPGTEQGRYCAKLDNTPGFFSNGSG